MRELEQLLNRTWLLADNGMMSGAARFVVTETADPLTRQLNAFRPARTLSSAEQEEQKRIAEALEAARGNVTEAARAFGKGRVQFHRLMKRLGIDAGRFRG